MHEKYNLTVEVDADANAEPSAEQVRLFLFDAARELLLNIVKHAKVDRAQVRLRMLGSGEIEVTVTDRGVGFEPARLGVPDSAAGGFGLFGIRERLSFLGGSMQVDASPGQGSRFTLAAPARLASSPGEMAEAANEAQSAAAHQPAASADGVLLEIERKVRVLIADDHPIVRQGLTRLLQEHPELEVVGEAGDGQRAVDLARRLRPDVILMDISLPLVNGLDATRQVVSEHPGIRVIGLSMHEESDMADAMRKAGAVAYMTKGGPTDQLIAAIRGSLTQGGKGVKR